MKSLLNIALALLASCSLSASCPADVSKYEEVSFSKINPVDSSLWIATTGRGLLRLGRNRKVFSYSSAKGDFPCDSIAALDFDADGVLWFLDANGEYYSYSSYNGFVRATPPVDIIESLAISVAEPLLEETEAPEDNSSSEAHIGASGFRLWHSLLIALAIVVLIFIGRITARKSPSPETSSNPGGNKDVSGSNNASVTPGFTVDDALKVLASDNYSAPAPAVSGQVEPNDVTKSKVTKSELQGFYIEVVKLVERNFTDPAFSVESIAEHFGISRVHLNRKLKAESKESPSEMIKSARMNFAAELLRSGNYSVVEVARKSGFSSAAYFSSAFKEYFHESPSSFLPTSSLNPGGV